MARMGNGVAATTPGAGIGGAMGTALAAALAAMLAAQGAAAQQEDGAAPRTVTVTGTGEVSAAPDLARLSLGVAARADDAAGAFAAAAAASAAVFAALEGAGVPRGDFATADIALGPVWSHGRGEGPPSIDGYEARQSLSVTVRALESLGPALDAAAAAGATDAGGVGFDVADRAGLLAAARRAAMADALSTARLLAEGAGARLGPALSIAMGGHGMPRPMMRAQMADAAAMPVAPGDATAVAEVTVTFALE